MRNCRTPTENGRPHPFNFLPAVRLPECTEERDLILLWNLWQIRDREAELVRVLRLASLKLEAGGRNRTRSSQPSQRWFRRLRRLESGARSLKKGKDLWKLQNVEAPRSTTSEPNWKPQLRRPRRFANDCKERPVDRSRRPRQGASTSIHIQGH